MTVITVTSDMWEALERYQPYADKRGFGAEWRRMTTERTEEAAAAVARVADEVWIEAVDATWVTSAEMAASLAWQKREAALAAEAAAAKATIAYLNKLIEGDPI